MSEMDFPCRMREVCRYLGYRGGALPDAGVQEQIKQCVQALQDAARPASIFRRFPIERPFARPAGDPSAESAADAPGARKDINAAGVSETIVLAGRRIESKSLSEALRGCEEAYLFAATLGVGPDRLIRRANAGRIMEAAIYQAAGAERIEAYCDFICGTLREKARQEGKSLRPRFSPGYGDFSLSFQRLFVSVLDTPKAIGLTLSDSLILLPSKSVTAVIGIGGGQETVLGGKAGKCVSCGMGGCPYRDDRADKASSRAS